jgi:hypothetical protein
MAVYRINTSTKVEFTPYILEKSEFEFIQQQLELDSDYLDQIYRKKSQSAFIRMNSKLYIPLFILFFCFLIIDLYSETKSEIIGNLRFIFGIGSISSFLIASIFTDKQNEAQKTIEKQWIEHFLNTMKPEYYNNQSLLDFYFNLSQKSFYENMQMENLEFNKPVQRLGNNGKWH